MSMRRITMHHEAGFSLIELLVVALMMGLVMAAVSTLYVSHQRAATVEAEVVDVQQNLRLAMDLIGQDVSMAGFLMTNPLTPISAAVNGGGPNGSDSLTINTASESRVAAAVSQGIPSVALALNDTLNVQVVASGGSVGGFENAVDANLVTPAKVRVVSYQNEPLGAGTTFTVLSVNPTAGTCGAVAAPCLSLSADAAANGAINAGDLVVKTGTAGAEGFPHTVQYSVAACPAPTPGFCLMRTTVPAVAGAQTVVATNTTDLQFRYLLTTNTEVDAPTAAELALIRAVRVTLNGQIVATTAVAGGATKTRSLMSVIAIRN
jgi:type II secretory pathway pseudopilin PulG